MFAQFFFIALYMQNILHYSPLQTGVRFLPSTLVIIVMGPLAGRLTDRVGPRPLMTLGLRDRRRGDRSSSRSITIHSGYGLLLPGLRADGPRHGPRDVADEHRRDERGRPHQGRRRLRRAVDEPDGRRHVRRRVMGALVATIGRSKIDSSLPHAPGGHARGDRQLRSAAAATLSGHHASAQIVAAVREAFVSALGTGLTIGAAVTLSAPSSPGR